MASSTILKEPLKFTKPMIAVIKGYIFENDRRILENGKNRYLNSNEFNKYVSKQKVNDLTKYYIKECKRLKNYDLRDVDQNLKSLNLI